MKEQMFDFPSFSAPMVFLVCMNVEVWIHTFLTQALLAVGSQYTAYSTVKIS
jgi:hypothetical protein